MKLLLLIFTWIAANAAYDLAKYFYNISSLRKKLNTYSRLRAIIKENENLRFQLQLSSDRIDEQEREHEETKAYLQKRGC